MRRPATFVTATILGAVLAACGSADDDLPSDAGGEVDPASSTATPADDAPSQDDTTEEGQPETILAFRVSGQSGSVVEVDSELQLEAGEQGQNLEYTLEDDVEGLAYSPFVLGVEYEVSVTEGGPVTFVVFRTPWDPDAAPLADFAEIEVVEELASAEIGPDTSVTLSVP